MLLESLKNRHVTVFGYGLEGQAVTLFLEERNCTVSVVEDPDRVPFSGIVVKSPGISLYRRDITSARQYGAVFTSSTNLFMEAALLMPDSRPLMIGVTGTKGKSTTASLIAHMLRAQGNRVALCGNIGDPAIGYANTLDEYEAVVVEMSSYQCADFEYSFDITLLLNLHPEHIDWHKSTEQYYKDKLKIFSHRLSHQSAILNAQDARTSLYVKNVKGATYFDTLDTIHIKDDYFYNGEEKLFKTDVVTLRGEHNLKNVCAALTVVSQAGGDLKSCEEAIKTFEPLPHRLETVAIKKGVRFIDDSISTTPQTAMEALKAFQYSNVILIAGGFDREQDYTELAAFVAKKGTTVITLPETGSRISENVISAGGKAISAYTMKGAVKKACEMAKYGDVVLLSPAAPSYGKYKNYQERGQDFVQNIERFAEE